MKRRRPFHATLTVAAATLALFLAACGGGTGSTTSSASSDGGEVLVGLTDAEGDFLRYEVDVESLELTRADGTAVETIPLDTRIDFAQLTDLTEFVAAATVPDGTYVAARLTLDYTNALIEVEGADGSALEAVAVGEDGTPLDTLELDVTLDNANHLVVAPGTPAMLTLDFDLSANHEVDLSTSPATVTVQPTLHAAVEPDPSKIHRVRGLLGAVDEEAGTFRVLRPPFRSPRRPVRAITMSTSESTEFRVNGVSASGAEGLALLAEASADPAVPVVVRGGVDAETGTFRAAEVLAGTSAPGGEQDGMIGVVVARDDASLTVRGAALDRSMGALFLGEDVTVTWTEGVVVTRALDPNGTYTPADVSVGQRVRILGTYSDDGGTATFQAERIRMLVTRIAGTVNDVQEGEVLLALEHIEGRRPGTFDFTGTGSTAEDDADPSDYRVNAGGLSLDGVVAEAPVRVFGFVTPFGQAPPDFEAVTVADYSEAVARLRVRWTDGSATELSVAEAGLTLDLTGAGALHHVFRGGVATELTAEPAPTLAPANPDRGPFVIHRRGERTEVYGRYAEFADALGAELAGGGHVAFLSGLGTFDPETQTFTARRIFVRLR
ncbi:MAG: DUF4382 domain-containing protein [Deltaproteobacteria bacterium]|nr:DUF4382 domain-containing protein [Deltaproteobacteria bacterium]